MIKNKSKKNKKKGFTLIELIIVIAILAILGAILVPQITGYTNKAKKSKAAADATTVCHAVATYNADAATPLTDSDSLVDASGNSITALTDTLGSTFPSELKGVATYGQLKTVQDASKYGTGAGQWDVKSDGTVEINK